MALNPSNSRPNDDPSIGPTLVSVPEVAGRLGVVVTKVHQLLRDRVLIGVRRDGVLVVPAEFIADDAVLRGLTGTITLLGDAGFSDDEMLGWLFATEPTTGVRPIDELRGGRVKHVHRQAQVAGF